MHPVFSVTCTWTADYCHSRDRTVCKCDPDPLSTMSLPEPTLRRHQQKFKNRMYAMNKIFQMWHCIRSMRIYDYTYLFYSYTLYNSKFILYTFLNNWLSICAEISLPGTKVVLHISRLFHGLQPYCEASRSRARFLWAIPLGECSQEAHSAGKGERFEGATGGSWGYINVA